MSITIVKGSQEYIKVTVIDNSDAPLTDLSGTTPQYDTTDALFTAVETAGTPNVSGMLLYCLIDSTDAGYVIGDKYYLFPYFSTAPEAPRLGPIPFFIV